MRQKANRTNAKNEFETQSKRAHIEGRRGPSDAKHRHVRSKKNNLQNGQPPKPPKPRTTPTPPAKAQPPNHQETT